MKWADRKAKLRRDFEREVVNSIRIVFPDLPTDTDLLGLIHALGVRHHQVHRESFELEQKHADLLRQRDEANAVLHRALDLVDQKREVAGPIFNAAAAILSRQFRQIKQFEEASKAGLELDEEVRRGLEAQLGEQKRRGDLAEANLKVVEGERDGLRELLIQTSFKLSRAQEEAAHPFRTRFQKLLACFQIQES